MRLPAWSRGLEGDVALLPPSPFRLLLPFGAGCQQRGVHNGASAKVVGVARRSGCMVSWVRHGRQAAWAWPACCIPCRKSTARCASVAAVATVRGSPSSVLSQERCRARGPRAVPDSGRDPGLNETFLDTRNLRDTHVFGTPIGCAHHHSKGHPSRWDTHVFGTPTYSRIPDFEQLGPAGRRREVR